MKIPQKLEDYINTNRAPLPPITDPDQPLQIDSLGLIRLVAFLESDLGIRVEDEELLAENFETVRKLGELIASKSHAAEIPSPTQPAIPAFTARREVDRPEVSKS
ncbi:MAG TPA: acyl carrier protein [Terriglobales bacterium]